MRRAGEARLPRQANTFGLLSERSEPPGTERAGGFMVKIAGAASQSEPIGEIAGASPKRFGKS